MATTNRISRETPLWRRIALPASIVVNLFLVALIGGHLLRAHRSEASSETPLARALARAEARLPSKDAAAFGAVIRRDASHYAEAQKWLIEARQELHWTRRSGTHVSSSASRGWIRAARVTSTGPIGMARDMRCRERRSDPYQRRGIDSAGGSQAHAKISLRRGNSDLTVAG